MLHEAIQGFNSQSKLTQRQRPFAAEAAGSQLASEQNAELRSKIEKIKEGCNRIKAQAVSGMRATDKLLRRYPYSSLGFAFGLGVLTAVLVQKSRK